MGIRHGECAGQLLYAQLRDGTAVREGCLPPVLTVVVYDGDRRWSLEADPLAGLPVEVAEALARHQPATYALLGLTGASGETSGLGANRRYLFHNTMLSGIIDHIGHAVPESAAQPAPNISVTCSVSMYSRTAQISPSRRSCMKW